MTIRTVLLCIYCLMSGLAYSATAAAEDGATRIVCIGDSITQGRAGQGDKVATYSWRYPLWKLCVDAGFNVEMVGSMTTGFGGSPQYPPHQGQDFVNHHEGRWGWQTRKVADTLAEIGPQWTADVGIIFLGTNDKIKEHGSETTLGAMRDIVTVLRQRNPAVKIAIGCPFQEWAPFPELSASYTALAAELSTEASPVIAVTTAQGWISNPDREGTHTVDWVHPNPKGDAHIASRVFAAIKGWLQ